MRGDDRVSFDSIDERDSTLPEIRVRALRLDDLLAKLAAIGGALTEIEEEIDSEPPPPMPPKS